MSAHRHRVAASRRRTVVTGGAAPAYGTQSLLAYGTRTSTAVPVPTGVSSGSVVLVHIYLEGTYVAVTPPAGFTEIAFGTTPQTTTSQMGVRWFWKRASAADSGTYAFTHASNITQAVATRWDGCVATGTPYEIPVAAIRDSAGTAVPAVSGTTTGANRTLVLWSQTYASPSYTPPSGFTEVYDPGDGLYLAYKGQAAAGATGSISATASASAAQIGAMIALLPT